MGRRYKVDFSPTAKLPVKDKMVYSLCAGLSCYLSWNVFSYYLMYFYTDVFGISALVAGNIILFSRVFDAFTDFGMGWLVDRTCWKSGKYRGWIKLGCIPMAIGFSAIFAYLPGVSYQFRIIWAAITYGTFGSIFCTLCFIPINSQLVNMTKNVEERASIVGIKEVFYNISVVLVAGAFLPMVRLFGGESNSPIGFFITAIIFALIALATMIANFIIQKKYELDEDGKPRNLEEETTQKEKESLVKQLSHVFHNRPAVVVLAGVFIMNITMVVKSSFMVYTFTYCFDKEKFFSVAMVFFTVAAIAGAVLIQYLVKLFKDSNRAFLVVMIGSIVFNVLYFVMIKGMGLNNASGSIQFGVLFVVFVISGIFQGAHYGFPNLLVPTAIEYGAWKTGHHQPGMIYGVQALGISIGGALGGKIVGLCLDKIHYVSNAAQSTETINGLLICAIIIPVALTVLQLIIHFFWGLSDEKYAKCIMELNERNQHHSEEIADVNEGGI